MDRKLFFGIGMSIPFKKLAKNSEKPQDSMTMHEVVKVKSKSDVSQGCTGIGKKYMRSISDVDWAGKSISEGSGAVG